ncbi:hypothetical protein H4219_000967 [Mycoemilia scoparia]|uniref:Chitin-binding type-4 domain-containing protein n=1 Tax=Mycoemilia scoparia TaxID=417184 RepID=A0A9W8DVY0_9FUNG|nr:hypothetical protein H4219_000967 [Mycoemilia scoparia]
MLFKFIGTLGLLASVCAGHSILEYPHSRGNVKWWGTCAAGAGCKGPCDSPKAESPFNSIYNPKTTFTRGQEIDVKWGRLNHPGGFVRLAIVPFDDSDSWDAFNNNVVKYVCFETNCGPTNPNDNTFGHLNGPGSPICSTKVSIPENLADGSYTLQWVWYGGGIYYGEVDTSFGEYYGCTDFKVNGGSSQKSNKVQATFQGGDVTYPNTDTCKYWGSNKVGDCSFGDRQPSPKPGDLLSQSLEPCMRGPPKQGKPFEFENGSIPSTNTTTPATPSPTDGGSSNPAPGNGDGTYSSVAPAPAPTPVQPGNNTTVPSQPLPNTGNGNKKCHAVKRPIRKCHA